MNEKTPKYKPVIGETKHRARALSTRPKGGPDETESLKRSSLGSQRATSAPPRQVGDRAAASSWETDGGSGT
jgi:hypothetical protein